MKNQIFNQYLLNAFLIAAFLCANIVRPQNLSAQEISQPVQIPEYAVGLVFGVNAGTYGINATPALSVLIQQASIKLSGGYSRETLFMAVNGDWILLDTPLEGTKFSWYIGPGVYAGFAVNSGANSFTSFAFGGRGVFGVRTMVFENFEIYADLAPAIGAGILNGNTTLVMSAELEIGVRYALTLCDAPERAENQGAYHE